MANILYKTEDDTQAITIPDPPNPVYPNTFGSDTNPNTPPERPRTPPPPPDFSYGDLIWENTDKTIQIYCDSYNGCTQ